MMGERILEGYYSLPGGDQNTEILVVEHKAFDGDYDTYKAAYSELGAWDGNSSDWRNTEDHKGDSEDWNHGYCEFISVELA